MLFLKLHKLLRWKALAATVRRGCKVLALLFLALQLCSSSSGETVTLDFPLKSQKLPAGLADLPRESFQGLAVIEIPLLPIEEDGSLLVSVVFQDDESRVIQAKWVSGKDETILAANLSEGVRAWNQRSFKIPSESLQKQGSLVLETDADVQPVRRINLTWMWPGGVYMASAAHTVEYVRNQDTVFTEKDLADTKPAPVPDSWANGVWKASLQEAVESLDDGLQFDVPMKTPLAAIFRAKLLGFPLSASPVVLVNEQKLSAVSLEVPALSSPGYLKGEAGEIGFAGWREVAVVIPPGLLQAGVNSILLEQTKGGYIKDAQLELSFEKEGAPLDLFEAPQTALEEKTVPLPAEDILSALDAPLENDEPSLETATSP